MDGTAESVVASNQRTPGGIFIKTFITHAFAIANFAQICHLIRIPPKHNARLFRILIFALNPSIALGQVTINVALCVVRVFKDLIEADLEQVKLDWGYVRFNLACCVGIYANVEHTGDDREEIVRLSDALESSTTTKHKHSPWTWARVGRVFICLLATAQAVGSVVLYARRKDIHLVEDGRRRSSSGEIDMDIHLVEDGRRWSNSGSGEIDMDTRNLYMAVGSLCSTVQAVPLLLFGNEWSLQPGAPFSPPVSEGKRVLLEAIVGRMLAAILSDTSNFSLDDSLAFVLVASAVVLAVAVASGFVPVIPNTRIRRSRPVQNACLLFLFGVFVWVVVVTIISFVNDVHSVWDMYPPFQTWSDPWEEVIPVI